jgi:hypothetical protein
MISDVYQRACNLKPKEFAIKYLLEDNTNTTDFIEQDPITIDIKIEGITKLENIQMDIVGIYSFRTTAACDPGNLSKRCISNIINIPSVTAD